MYFKVIETSQNWTCPKTGTYLITCVGGGYGGTTNGGTTSFGSYLSAAGGLVTVPVLSTSLSNYGGVGGYTLDGVYGGAGSNGSATASKNGGIAYTAGIGYGAGGGSSSQTPPGDCGALSIETFELTAGQVISCTIGTVGAATAERTAGKSGVITIKGV